MSEQRIQQYFTGSAALLVQWAGSLSAPIAATAQTALECVTNSGKVLTCSSAAAAALAHRSMKNAMPTYGDRKLVRAGLAEWNGVATELGTRVARHLLNGRQVALQVKGSPPRMLTFWIDGPRALAVLSFISPDTNSDRSALGFCPTERIPR